MRPIGLAVLAVIVAGCAAQPGNEGPPQPAPTSSAPAPKDRDERAVISALRHLDACALIEPGASQPKATGPHRCVAGTVAVTLGVRFGREQKYRALPLDLSGTKAYVDVSEPGTESCRVAIPVSFGLSIEVVVRTGSGDSCVPATSAAAAAVRRLPASATGSAANWTACELLASTFGGSKGLSNDGPAGLDGCTASEQGERQFQASLDYGDDPSAGNVRTVAGQRVAVVSDSSGCTYRWRTGTIVVGFHTIDCAQGDPLVEKLIGTLATANREKAPPQNPLLIRSDEPDNPVAGACVDFPYSTNCQPGTAAAVSQGGEPALRAAAADPTVACALAADAVHGSVGPALTPVLASRTDERPHCYFVEPTHTTVIEVSARPDDGLPGSGSDATVAGRPGKLSSDAASRTLCVLPVAEAKTGLLCVTVTFLPGRGKESGSPVDDGASARLEPALATIVSGHFS